MITKNSAIATMTVGQMAGHLVRAYAGLNAAGIPFRSFPSVMLWGAPGVGKSQGVRQIASQLQERTGKKVAVTDVRLLLFNPVDLRGIPTANADKTLAVWLKPKIFQMDSSDRVINILFLDEISAAPQSVQASAYQITLDRTVGEHALPENCIVLAAGNRVTDRSVAYHMPKALANRLCHLDIVSDAQSWHRWAVDAGIHPVVTGFLAQNPSMLMLFQPGSDELAFPTPRSWEMVSNILRYVSEDMAQVFPLIAGCIGDNAAYALRVWSEVASKIPEVSRIFDGSAQEIPTRPEILYAVASQITSHARTHHTESDIRNILRYASRLPVEFRNSIFADLLQIKSARKILSQDRAFNDWFHRSGKDWDDYGL